MLIRVLILILSIAIGIQNTCPQGWAAKTAFVTCGSAKQSAHCPMHEKKESKQDRQDDGKKGISIVKQAFVIHIVSLDNAFQMLEYETDTQPIASLSLTEIFSEPLSRPPIPASFA